MAMSIRAQVSGAGEPATGGGAVLRMYSVGDMASVAPAIIVTMKALIRPTSQSAHELLLCDVALLEVIVGHLCVLYDK